MAAIPIIKKTLYASFRLLALILLLSCGGGNTPVQTDTPTRGNLKVAIDDSYKLLMDAEISTFEAIYPYASFNPVYAAEADVINLFLKDSVQLMLVNRKLTSDEETYLNARQIIPKTTRIAYDAIALIVNNENPDSNLFYDHIRDIFKGKITTWKQINPLTKLGDLKVVFDHYKSGNPRYFKERFGVDSLPKTCYALNSNSEVIDFVDKNKDAIGIISVNWISDRRDSVSQDFLRKVRVAGISDEGTLDPTAGFYQPYQYYIAQGFYPFSREVYFINRQTYSGLAYGLTAFVAGDKGQLIVLHSGLVPSTMPVRIVEIRK